MIWLLDSAGITTCSRRLFRVPFYMQNWQFLGHYERSKYVVGCGNDSSVYSTGLTIHVLAVCSL